MNGLRVWDRGLGRWLDEGGRAVLLTTLVLAALVCLAFQVATIGFRYQIDYGEAPLVDQAVRLASGESIYQPDLTHEPFTISNYPPLYVATLAAFVPFAGPAFWPGRLVSAVSIWAAALFLGLIVHTTTRDRVAAVIAGLSLAAWPYVVLWSTLARIDNLALALSLGGLWVLVRWPKTTAGLLVGGLLLVASIYTRQSYALAAPLAGFVWLWSVAGWRRAFGLAAWVGGLSGGLFAVLYALTGGGFLLHIVTANVNAYSIDTVRYWAEQVWSVGWPLIVLGIASLVLIRRWNPLYAVAAPYLLAATASAATIGKIGSNANYLLELLAALGLAAGVWAAFLRERQSWALLRAGFLLLVAFQAALMLEMTFTRFPGETPARLTQAAELDKLEKLVAGADGPVLADEQMGMVTLAGKRLMLQPFEMTQLAAAGVWDQKPLLEAMKAGEYDLIIQYDVPWVRERWSPEMFAALDESYRLTAVIGNNRVFKPRTAAVATGPTTCEGAPWSVPTRAELGVRWDDGALIFFGRGIENQIPVVAVADGETRVLDDRPGAIGMRQADPLNPGQDLWMVFDGLANGTGDVSYVSESLTTGGTVSAGTTIGEQGSWSGKATFPMWVHVRVALVRPTASGDLPAVISAADYLDPRPYFGLDLPDPGAMTGSKTLACATP